MYTMENWKKDGTFKAEPMEEVTEEIYTHFLNCMPPMSLLSFSVYGRYACGFGISEPYGSTEDGRNTYSVFAGDVNGKYYYLGNLPRSK